MSAQSSAIAPEIETEMAGAKPAQHFLNLSFKDFKEIDCMVSIWDRRLRSMSLHEVSNNEPDLAAGYTGVGSFLHEPVWALPGTYESIKLDFAKIYPPFETSAMEGRETTVRKTKYPISDENMTAFPEGAVATAGDMSFSEINDVFFRGIRIDSGPKIDCQGLLNFILERMREMTAQWWINRGFDPWDHRSRIAFARAACAREPRFDRTTVGMSRSFKAIGGYQAIPLTPELWKGIGTAVREQWEAEYPTRYFLDAVASHQNYQDTSSVILACVAMEAMETKARAIEGRPRAELKRYGKQLFKNSVLWRKEDRNKIEKLFKFRNDLAHGKMPDGFYKVDGSELFSVCSESFSRYRNKYLSGKVYPDVCSIVTRRMKG